MNHWLLVVVVIALTAIPFVLFCAFYWRRRSGSSDALETTAYYIFICRLRSDSDDNSKCQARVGVAVRATSYAEAEIKVHDSFDSFRKSKLKQDGWRVEKWSKGFFVDRRLAAIEGSNFLDLYEAAKKSANGVSIQVWQ